MKKLLKYDKEVNSFLFEIKPTHSKLLTNYITHQSLKHSYICKYISRRMFKKYMDFIHKRYINIFEANKTREVIKEEPEILKKEMNNTNIIKIEKDEMFVETNKKNAEFNLNLNKIFIQNATKNLYK